MNGRSKQLRYCNNVIPNAALPYVHDYLQIVRSIVNAFQTSYVQNFTEGNNMTKIVLERKDLNAMQQQQLENKDFLETKLAKNDSGVNDSGFSCSFKGRY